MAAVTSLTNTASQSIDPIADTGGTTRLKRALAPVSATGLDSSVASQAVGTHVDDAAFTVATDAIVVAGGLADDTSPDSVNEGDAGGFRMTLARKQIVVVTADVATVTTVNSTNSSTTLLAANANRIGATVYNTDANDLYVKFGATASTSSFTVVIPQNGYYEFPLPVYRGVVDGIWGADGAGLAAMTELT